MLLLLLLLLEPPSLEDEEEGGGGGEGYVSATGGGATVSACTTAFDRRVHPSHPVDDEDGEDAGAGFSTSGCEPSGCHTCELGP